MSLCCLLWSDLQIGLSREEEVLFLVTLSCSVTSLFTKLTCSDRGPACIIAARIVGMIEGKTNDPEKARLDLADMNIRQELHLQLKDNGSYAKPQACYTLTSDERKDFCKFLKSVKFPDSFASNIARCVNVNEGNILVEKS
ncbi:hypothetical protein Dsin_019510 [Dipteronia sinensis]|uniref:Uncharacterized protein n=1 Tax=Dipteronia sinensis TaxID=43782 RepID=A0AAE0A823_9ROSI|nr:hypothetical protein Dsin_019510 [Dipteronia sinensis]